MTKDEVNEFLTVELFGECWHEAEIVELSGYGIDGVTRRQCAKCPETYPTHPDYFTGDGILKVINAMRARMLNVDTSSDVLNHGASCFDDHTGQPDKRNWTYTDNLPEAVARAAVEFLKGEKE